MDTLMHIGGRTLAATLAILLIFPLGPLCMLFAVVLRFPDLVLEALPHRTAWALRRFGQGMRAEAKYLYGVFKDAVQIAGRGRR